MKKRTELLKDGEIGYIQTDGQGTVISYDDRAAELLPGLQLVSNASLPWPALVQSVSSKKDKAVQHPILPLTALIQQTDDTATILLAPVRPQLEDANCRMHQIMRVVSHDLRSSFSAFRHFLTLFNDTAHHSAERSMLTLSEELDSIMKSGELLLDNLRIFSRMSFEQIPCSMEAVMIQELIEKAVSEMQIYTAYKQIEIQTQSSEEVLVLCDADIITAVLKNIIFVCCILADPSSFMKLAVAVYPDQVMVSADYHGMPVSLQLRQTLQENSWGCEGNDTIEDHSVGFCLYISQLSLESHNSHVIFSESNTECCFPLRRYKTL